MEFFYFDQRPIKVTLETTIVTRYTFPKDEKMWELPSLKQFFNQIDPDKKVNIVDIGAQSGLYTLYSKYLPNAHFYAYEPFPSTFKLLNDNLKLNQIPESRVTTINKAVSDKNGKAVLNLCNNHNGLHTMGSNLTRFSPSNSTKLEVDAVTLDQEFYEKNIPVDYIKIDTEGWEYYVLLGAQKTIAKYKPVIQLEWNLDNLRQCNIQESQLKDLLSSLGYHEKCMVEEEKLFVYSG